MKTFPAEGSLNTLINSVEDIQTKWETACLFFLFILFTLYN